MENKTIFIFLCLFLCLSYCQDECQQSRLQKIQTGEIVLNPNDLGQAGANKNYYQSLERGKFGKNDFLGHAFALAGFETLCSQSFFSMVVDIVQPQSENTKLKIVIDFRNKAGTGLTIWTKIKLSYLVVSAQRYPTGVNAAYIWATSQQVDLSSGNIMNKPIFTDSIFTSSTGSPNDYDRGKGCGLEWDTSSNKYKFGIRCDQSLISDNKVSNDVAIHSYIMGFQYEPNSNHLMAATMKWESWMNSDAQRQLAYYTDASATNDRSSTNYGIKFSYNVDVGGPHFLIDAQANSLKSIKIAIVMTVINPAYGSNALRNGFDAQKLSYSYSGLYSIVDPGKFNIKTLIDNDNTKQWNNLHEKIPIEKYKIYGLSSFKLRAGNGCTSFNLNVLIDSPDTFTVLLNHKDSVENVVLQADIYFPQLSGVCGSGVQFQKLNYLFDDIDKILYTSPSYNDVYEGKIQNMKYIKTRGSEVYETIPSDQVFQLAHQFTDAPLYLRFFSNAKLNQSSMVHLNAEVVMNGLNEGKPYGIHLIIKPQTTRTDKEFLSPKGQKFQFQVSVNGKNLYKKTFNSTQMKSLANFIPIQQYIYGINIQGTQAKFVVNITVPRDSTTDKQYQTYHVVLSLVEFRRVYDPVTQCCVSKCPSNTGLDVTVTPVQCVACDPSKGLYFDASRSACACAEGFYLNSALGSMCFACETKLCSRCDSNRPSKCLSCISGASLNIFDNSCSCQIGFFENNGTCTKCPSRCSTCSIGSVCDTCSDKNRDFNRNCSCITGFYDAGIDKCVSCNPTCVTCLNSMSCSTCDERKFRTLKDNLCVCFDGYFQLMYDNGTRVCEKCSSECKTCSQSAIECTSCAQSFNRIEGYDSLNRRTCICKSGYHSLPDGMCIQSNCKADKYCSECESQLQLCIQCQTSLNRVLKMPQHICVCADGFYEDKKNGSCLPCSRGCSKCSSAEKCLSCVAQSINNNNGICKCNDGTYFGISTTGVRYCQTCLPSCQTCNNGLQCLTCKRGYQQSTDGKCVCMKNNFVNQKGQCVPCMNGCQICLTNRTCQRCKAPLVLEDNLCKSTCSQGYFLSGAKCISCPKNCEACTSGNKCFYCKNQTYLHGGICYDSCPAGTLADKNKFECIPCNSPCKTCVNHPSQCTSCEPGEGYLQVLGSDQKCVKQCAQGTYPKGGVCQVCDFRCSKCLGSASYCIACPLGNYLFNGTCWSECPGIIMNNSCISSCPAGYYRSSQKQCRECSSQCQTCTDRFTCVTCANGLLSLEGNCVKSCSQGYYEFRGICVACDKSCKNCQKSPMQCTQCALGYVNTEGRCVKSCSQGTFLEASSNSCRRCSTSCKTCSAQNYCLTCHNSKIQPIAGLCLNCTYPCQSCSQDLSKCFDCQSGFYLFNGECVRSCPSGTRRINKACVCVSGLTFEGKCVFQCPSGYTKVGQQCKKCQSPCTECFGSVNFCTDCLDFYTLKEGRCQQDFKCNYGQIQQNSKCKKICPSNSFFANGTCHFGQCPQGYKNNDFGGCIAVSVITNICEPPTFRLEGVCTQYCGPGRFPNSNTRTCEQCNIRCKECINKDYCLTCNQGYQAVDGKCIIQVKCSNSLISYNGLCVIQCPPGTYQQGKKCVRLCPPGSFFFMGFCYNNCPDEAKLYTDEACVRQCPLSTINIDGVCATIAI